MLKNSRFEDILKFVTVPVTNHTWCQETYRRQRVTISDSQVCAGGKKGSLDILSFSSFFWFKLNYY